MAETAGLYLWGLCLCGCPHGIVPTGLLPCECASLAVFTATLTVPLPQGCGSSELLTLSSPYPAVTPPPSQPVPSSSLVSTSLVTDLEGLMLTDTSLAPTVSVTHTLASGSPLLTGGGQPAAAPCPLVSPRC